MSSDNLISNKRNTNKLKGKVRDKVKQVLLVEGAPSCLYNDREKKFVHVKVNNIKYYLGVISDDFVEELKKISHFEIIETKKIHHYPICITLSGVGNRTTIRKVNGNTHIQVGASDEQQLTERIEQVKEYLISKGVKVSERCHWICSVDKKQEVVNPLYKDNKEVTQEKIPVVEDIEKKSNIREKLKEDINISKQKKRKELKEMVIRMGIQ